LARGKVSADGGGFCLKPRQGWPVYSTGAASSSFLLFFSGASLARLPSCPPAAPLKNKRKAGAHQSVPLNHLNHAMANNHFPNVRLEPGGVLWNI
jgi:hypothetical protein